MTTAQTITATFRGSLVALSVTGLGTGSGLVTAAGGMSCRITKGVAATAGCTASATLGTNVTLTADPQDGSIFAGWSVASCASSSLTCAVPVNQATSVSARFTAPAPAAQLVDALLLGPSLAADQAAQLDRFGNNDGVFNLGDLLAQLDRSGETVSASVIARILDADAARAKSNRTTSPRRTP
jgi:hypothetical protein